MNIYKIEWGCQIVVAHLWIYAYKWPIQNKVSKEVRIPAKSLVYLMGIIQARRKHLQLVIIHLKSLHATKKNIYWKEYV